MRKISFVAIMVSIMMASGCSNRESCTVSTEAQKFKEFYEHSCRDIVTANIVAGPKTRVDSPDQSEGDTIVVDVFFPEDTPNEVKRLCELATTAQDLSALHRLTAAEYSIEDELDTTQITEDNYRIFISESKVKEALSPSVIEAKAYLMGKGMTEDEIQDMLAENDADETELVGFSLLLMNCEYENAEIARVQKKKAGFHWYDLIATPCIAKEEPFLDAAADCAFDALGGAIVHEIFLHGVAAITKSFIKSAFKKYVLKTLGVVGAVITIADFGFCMYEKGYTCVYAARTPIDDAYDSLEKGGLIK